MHSRKDLHMPSTHLAILDSNQITIHRLSSWPPHSDQFNFFEKHRPYAITQQYVKRWNLASTQQYVKRLNFASTQHLYRITHLSLLDQRSLGNYYCNLFAQEPFSPEWDKIAWQFSSKGQTRMRWESKLLDDCCCIQFFFSFYSKYFDLSGIKTPMESHVDSI